MKSKYNVSDAEREVLEVLWEQTEPIKQAQLLTLLEERGREWKRQTLNTFLSRLEEKKLVIRANRMVSAAYSEEDYNALQMQEAIDRMYGGMLSNFVAAFAIKNAISEEDAKELRKLLDEKG